MQEKNANPPTTTVFTFLHAVVSAPALLISPFPQSLLRDDAHFSGAGSAARSRAVLSCGMTITDTVTVPVTVSVTVTACFVIQKIVCLFC